MSLEKVSWTFRPDSVVHTSPVIDDESNVYITEIGGRLVSLTKSGVVRWTFKTPGTNPSVPALAGDAVYIITDSGVAVSLNLADGSVRWQHKIAKSAPTDSQALLVVGDVVLMGASNLQDQELKSGNCDVIALKLTDGSVKWTYEVCKLSGNFIRPTFNMLPSEHNGTVVIHDSAGGMHAFSVQDGTQRWYVPAYNGQTMSTGASVIGPVNLAYCGFVYAGYSDAGQGMLRAHNLATGEVVWTKTFSSGINAGVATGPLGPAGRPAVVAAVSNNFMPQLSPLEAWLATANWLPFWFKILLVFGRYSFPGSVVVLDAETGDDIWTFDLGSKQVWGYNGIDRGCLPDAFGTPSIGADGTVYVNWSGGRSYALRDANGDGRVDPNNPLEVSVFIHGFGMNGQTAIAPGLLVAPSCDAIFGWTT